MALRLPALNISLKSKEYSDGRRPIMVTISYLGESKRILIGHAVLPSQFDLATRRAKKSAPDAVDINKILARYDTEFKSYIDRLEGIAKDEGLDRLAVTASQLEEEMVKRAQEEKAKARAKTRPKDPGTNFFAFADNLIEGLRTRGQHGHQFRLTSAVKTFRDFAGEDLGLEDITTRLLDNYHVHLITMKYETGKRKGERKNTNATAFVNFRNIQTLYKKAQRIHPELPDPFKNTVDRDRGKPRKKQRLTLDDIKLLADLQLPAGSSIERSRDLFLFAYETHGSRVGDMIQLRWDNIERTMVSFFMAKTDTDIQALITPLMDRILARYKGRGKYVFAAIPDDMEGEALAVKVKTITALVNKDLKVIARRARLSIKPELLTTHIARHSFAAHLYEATLDIRLVQKALGHKSLATTERYIGELGLGDLHQKMEAYRAKQAKL